MKEIRFEKKGIEFIFRNPKLNEYGDLVFEYKVPKYRESDNADGFYYNSKYLENKGAIELDRFEPIDIKGMKVGGVGLPVEIKKEVQALYELLSNERDTKINLVIEEIINGERFINFSIVGCDFPHYQGWLRDIPSDLKGLEQNIMEKAIIKAIKDETGEKIYVSNSCKYIKDKLKQSIANKDGLNKKTFNLKWDREIQKYHGYKDTIVTNFDMKLLDILNIDEMKRKEEERRKKVEEQEIKKQEELFIFGTEILSSAGNQMLHSIGAIFGDEILVYTTGMTRFMKKEGIKYNDTYKIKNILNEKDFEWVSEDKHWKIENTEKNQQMVVELLKKYDTKVDPKELGLTRCWECGSWKYPSELDETGYCGC